jgi:hypothetical protein
LEAINFEEEKKKREEFEVEAGIKQGCAQCAEEDDSAPDDIDWG